LRMLLRISLAIIYYRLYVQVILNKIILQKKTLRVVYEF